MANPFECAGVWLRCALHAHTTNSDGELPPPLLVEHYERAGFDVLAITDHSVRTVVASTPRLLVIPGSELGARVGRRARDAHVLALGIGADPAPRGSDVGDLPEVVGWVSEVGGVPFLAHPYWSGLRADDFQASGVAGLEVFNGASQLETGRGPGTVHWDDALETGRHLLGIATDDCHRPRYESSLAWVWARAGERSEAALLAAIRDGCFYSSTGPELSQLAVGDDAVEVRTTPARRVTLVAGRKKGASVSVGRPEYVHNGEVLDRDGSGAITAVRLYPPVSAPYGRLEIEDVHGRTAWTNPVWP